MKRTLVFCVSSRRYCGLLWWLITVKILPELWETLVSSLSWEEYWEKGMAAHSSILAWRISRTEELYRPQSMGLQRDRHN